MRLRVLSIVFAAFVLTAAPAEAVHAGQTGQILSRPTTVAGTTGSCSCLERWFTAGLRRGHVTIKATLNECAVRTYKVCTLTVYLLAGHAMSVVKGLTLRCSSRRCGETGNIRVAIHRAGLYHLAVHGDGAASIVYRMRISGDMYRPRCGAPC